MNLSGLSRLIKEVKKTKMSYLFISYAMFILFFSVLIPAFYSFYLSFFDYSLLKESYFIGLANFVRLSRDPIFWIALKNTTIYSGGVTVFLMVISLALALILNRSIKGRVFFRASYFMPVITSMVLCSVIWKIIYHPSAGLINFFLAKLGLSSINFLGDVRTALFSIMVVGIWKGMGYYMVLFLAGLQGIPEEYYEAARIDGANRWNEFRSITLPLLRNIIVLIIILSTASSFQVFDQVWVMTYGGPAFSTTTLALLLVNTGFKYFDLGYSASIGLIFFIILFTICIIQRRIIGEQKS